MLSPAGQIEFSEEQGLISDSAINFCRDRCPIEKVRTWISGDIGYDPSVWQEMASLGWCGMLIPDTYGGAGLSPKELVSVFEPMGRHLVGSPLLATTLAGQLILKAGNERHRANWLEQLASGSAIGAVALSEPAGSFEPDQLTAAASATGSGYTLSGVKRGVLDAATADVVVISAAVDGSPALFLVEGSALKTRMRQETLVDETRRAYRIELDGLQVPAADRLDGGDATQALKWTYALGALIHSAENAGGANGALLLTIDYLNTRKQFDKLIGSYQALKHPTVDVMVGVEHTRSHLYYAASVFNGYDGGEPEAAVRIAKIHSDQAFYFASDRAIQFHGGMGFTYECNAGLHFRRAQGNRFSFGDDYHHRKHLRAQLPT